MTDSICHLKRAIKILKTQELLADSIGVGQSDVSQWVTERRPIPALRCRYIEKATKGAVTRYQLRPDIFGNPPTSGESPDVDQAA